ncbi:TPA: hypothetical protein ACVBCY_000077 [Aeromonas hydrophila]
MSKLTICPHLLFGYEGQDPEDIEENIILPLRHMLLKAQKLGVDVVLSEFLVEKMMAAFPWHKTSEPEWRGYLLEWNETIMKNIANRTIIVTHENEATNNETVCSEITQEVNDTFVNFLNDFIENRFSVDHHAEGVISTTHCGPRITYKKIYQVTSEDSIYAVIHPWLRIYDMRLPYKGEFPFVPVRNWMNMAIPLRGQQHGFIDEQRREWVWDRLHDNHWDVQMIDGYQNVAPDGRIL